MITVDKRISELEDMSVETFQMENRKKMGKKTPEYSRITMKGVRYV